MSHSIASALPHQSSASDRIGVIADRWIYVFMAGLFVTTALTGFVPDSFLRLAAIEAGERPPFATVVHVHAVVMGSWLLLLLAQSYLVATGRRALHRQLGIASLVLVIAVPITMIAIVVDGWEALLSLTQVPPNRVQALSNTLLLQIRGIVLFSVFATWALLVRKSDPDSHRRLWLLAATAVISAAIARITWLPRSQPASPLTLHAFPLLLLTPALIVDIVRRGRVHRTYVIGLLLLVSAFTTTHVLWSEESWRAFAVRMISNLL